MSGEVLWKSSVSQMLAAILVFNVAPRALVAPPAATTIVGGGPSGLATAIMLAQKGFKCIQVLDRLPAPAAAVDDSVWSDTARHYLVGLGGRGQRALDEIGCWEGVVEPFCSTVVGRKDWNPGAPVDGGVERIFTDRPYLTRVIPRDRMVSVLYEHIRKQYDGTISIRHGVEVTDVVWETTEGEADAEEAVLTVAPCSIEGGAEYSGSEECAVDDAPPLEMRTPLLIGADGARRTIAHAMEADDTNHRTLLKRFGFGRLDSTRFRVRRFVDTNVRVYKTVPLELPGSWRRDINYSCRTSTVNFDALPTLDGKLTLILTMILNLT